MRKFSLIASVTLLMGSALTSTGPSLAADCTKGMLWPYVRAAGDCLTDAEIAAGQKGAYSGPTNTNVDVGAIKPADIPAQTNTGGGGNTSGALIDTSVFGASAPSRPAEQCRKGILWPFDREPGDCLTEREKQEGQTGVFGGAAATQASTTPVPAASASPNEAPQGASQPASCSRSWLWPFVKESGDCQTVGDKRSEETGVRGGAGATQAGITPAVVPAAAAPSAATPQPAPQAASCSKSWLWPFVKESGDCQSAAEKQAGGAAVATQPMPTAMVPAVATSSAAARQPAPQAASCSKSWLWPFVKDSGDCLSAAEKQAGGAPAATQPTGTVPTAATSLAAAPQPAPQAASCSKSWLWPFVKESGDCLSAAEKQAGGTPMITQASAATAIPTAAAPSAQPAQAPQPTAQPAAQTVSCSKPLLWPFVKESGDCSTDADKKSGQR